MSFEKEMSCCTQGCWVHSEANKEKLRRHVTKATSNALLLKSSNWNHSSSINLPGFLPETALFLLHLLSFFFVWCKYKRYVTKARLAAATNHLLFYSMQMQCIMCTLSKKMVSTRNFQGFVKLRKANLKKQSWNPELFLFYSSEWSAAG